MSVCNSCGARIRWAVMPSGKRMPLDVTASASGNLVVVEPQRMLVGFAQPGDSRPRYTSHFATCPNAAAHRRRD
jgi:hypothetical protein